jgi:class 3 adenylate cyclase/tetratricopeptide (TPR) repeat protein
VDIPSRTGSDRRDEICSRIRAQLDHGAPWDACDTFREARAQYANDAELLYWGALAHARAGAAHEAHMLLDQAQGAGGADARLVSILSLRGRLWKDEYHRAPDAADATMKAARARREYSAAYERTRDPYPGVNAATLAALLGERDEAERLAREILARLAPPDRHTCWDHATAGEAYLLCRKWDAARECYAAAFASAPGDAGTIATMRRQVRLLSRALPEAVTVLDVLPGAAVCAFAGHMIDAADRASPRFPPSLVPAVTTAVRERLARLYQPVVYTSAACGADLILIEAALEIGAEVNVVLPFDRDDFVRESVAPGGAEWVGRFGAALAGASRVIMATEEGYLDDDVLFDYAALLLEGLTVLRAAQLETTPTLLCVLDPDSEAKLGGTQASFERWRRHFGAPQTIDLRELRERHVADVAAAPAAQPQTTSVSIPSAVAAPRPSRTLKTLLFADFAGYSRIHDAYAPLFQRRFLEIVAAEIEAAPAKPLDSKTWGDALYSVFESPQDGAEFAVRLQRSMLAVDWRAAGLAESSRLRIALHAGPVFCGFDPIMGRDNYFGASVTRTSRIEPVTPPGVVYASEAFAAMLVATGGHGFAPEFVGRLPLAKDYGEARIYRLDPS